MTPITKEVYQKLLNEHDWSWIRSESKWMRDIGYERESNLRVISEMDREYKVLFDKSLESHAKQRYDATRSNIRKV